MTHAGPLRNFGAARDATGAWLTRSAQPDDAAWRTLVAAHQGWSSSYPHHYSLNGVAGPPEVESVVFDWPVFRPSLVVALGVAAMVGADLSTGRSVHVNCLRGSDRTGFLFGLVRLRRFGWSIDDVLAERALFLVTPVFDLVIDARMVEMLRYASQMRKV